MLIIGFLAIIKPFIEPVVFIGAMFSKAAHLKVPKYKSSVPSLKRYRETRPLQLEYG